MKDEKRLKYREEARAKLFKGVEILADAVTTTLGPKGRNVAIQSPFGPPYIVHDGVTVAREVGHKDPFVRMGIDLVHFAAATTNNEAGDGTTTATLLAYEIVKAGLKLINKGKNPMVLRNEVKDALPKLLKKLEGISVSVKSSADIARVATISSADKDIGLLVAEAIDKVGGEGLVTVEENKVGETIVEYTKGLEFNQGFISPYFINNPNRLESVIEEPAVAIVSRKISFNNEIKNIVEPMAKVSKDMVLICEGLSGDALTTTIVNKQKGTINFLGVKTPPVGVGDTEHFLEDLAIFTGARVVKNDSDLTPDGSWIGRADKVVANKDATVIVRGRGDKKSIEKRVQALKDQIELETNVHLREKIEERLAKLTKGVAVIKVGSKTSVDMRERIERVKDAVGAAEAAREEGVVVGGGTAFLRLKEAVDGKSDGEKLLESVLETPTRKLMSNSGEKDENAEKMVQKIIKEGGNLGYEVNSGQVKDLVKAGIIDPTKVIRLSLENAISVATTILTTDVLIGIKPKPKQQQNVG